MKARSRPKPASSAPGPLAEARSDRDVHARNRAFEGRQVGDIARERARRRSTRCSTSSSPTNCVPACARLRAAPSPTTRGRCAPRRGATTRTIVGGSDAGAHLDMMCGATYSTFVVGDAVRKGAAHDGGGRAPAHRVPARFYGVRDRGRIAAGLRRRRRLRSRRPSGRRGERTHEDLPGGASRSMAKSTGSTTCSSTVSRSSTPASSPARRLADS